VWLFKPATVVGWHRELVRRKWTFERSSRGRPRIDAELESWIVQLAKDNPRLGYGKLQGELKKLGFEVCSNTIKQVLKRHGIPPAPERSRHGFPWRTFLSHYQDQIIACDFFTVETLWLQTLYVFYFIELGSRYVRFAGCTGQPNAAWVTQQARQTVWNLEDKNAAIYYLIHDRDTKFTRTFDSVFESTGIKVVRTPAQAPNTNAYAERWVRSVREECLDHLLIWNEHHLRRVMTEYVDYYNARRPHQSLRQNAPLGLDITSTHGAIQCRQVLGGINSGLLPGSSCIALPAPENLIFAPYG
jgi:putative transposase